MNVALRKLRDDATVASEVMRALHVLFGNAWLAWEPETVWYELQHQGCEISEGNRAQALAGRNLLTTGRYFYDAVIFDKTAAAFANEVITEGVEESLVAHLAWSIDEATRISEDHDDPMLGFDREVVEFTALRLRDEGFVLAPKELSFAQKALDRLWGTPEAAELKQDVQELWDALSVHAIRDVPYPENAKGVQLARLASVEAFLAERRAARAQNAS